MVKSFLTHKSTDSEPEWPKLMTNNNGLVVLFTEPGIGTVVHKGGSASYMGEHYKDWAMKYFRTYNGTVTLEN